MPSYRMPGGQIGRRGQPKTEGTNHPGGVMIHYYLKDTAQVKASLEIMEANGTLIKKFSTKPDKKANEESFSIKPGMNRFGWNMRYPNADGFDGMILWAGGLNGPVATPGVYKARLTVNGKASETEFEILKDPRTSGTMADITEQFDFLISVRDKLSETNNAVKKIRTAREQINRVNEPLKGKEGMKDINDLANVILEDMRRVEEALYQTKNRSGQDPLNFPVRLNNKLAALASEADGSDFKPTIQVKEVYKEISGKIDEQFRNLNRIMDAEIPKFNELVRQKQINAVVIQ
jgi:hypothetical protein